MRLEHVGSTAVPGLAAKPILDLQLSVASLEPCEAYGAPLARLGYLFVPDPEMPDYRFFGRPPERPRTHHLHVCEAGSEHEHRHLAVRDFLRAHPDEAASYAALKRAVAERHPQDRLAYITGKDRYVAGWRRGRCGGATNVNGRAVRAGRGSPGRQCHSSVHIDVRATLGAALDRA